MTLTERFRVSPLGLTAATMLVAGLCLTGPLLFSHQEQVHEREESLVGTSVGTFLSEYCFIKSQAYFHSGAYFTIYDHKIRELLDCAAIEEDSLELKETWRRKSPFAGPVLDPLDGFGRNFYPIRHTHLSSGGTKEDEGSKVHEMLPWLELAIEIDPNYVDAYTEADFWLRKHLKRPEDAVGFLRRGLVHNPNSYEINFLLGQLEAEKDEKSERALALWSRALWCWNQQNLHEEEPDILSLRQITASLARLEENRGNLKGARNLVRCLVDCGPSSKGPARWLSDLDRQISELQ